MERRRSRAGAGERAPVERGGGGRGERLIRFIESRSSASVQAGALALLGLIGWLDYSTGPEVGVSIFYLVPLAVVAWRSGGPPAAWFSLLGALEWYLAEALGGRPYSNPLAAYWNALVRLGIFLTVTSLVGATRRLIDRERALARTDPGTGLANARHFYEAAEREIRALRGPDDALTLAYLDVDDFKQVNDRLGHAAGDAVLRGIGESLAASVRSTDLAARLGGDEFALLLPRTPFGAAGAVLRRVKERLDAQARERGWSITFSVGALTTGPPLDVDDLVRRADTLMYGVKREGKDGLRHERAADQDEPAGGGALPSAHRRP